MASLGIPATRENAPVASGGHMVIMLLIQLALLGWGFHLQHQPSSSDSVLPENRNACLFTFQSSCSSGLWSLRFTAE